MNRVIFLTVALCALSNAQYPWPVYQQFDHQYQQQPQWGYDQQPYFNQRPILQNRMQFQYPTLEQYPSFPEQEVIRAVVKLDGTSNVNGVVNFTQPINGGPVRVQGYVNGLGNNGKNGFHVHEKGDITGGCLSAGSHFNPQNMQHGGPDDEHRHVGDLGNIESFNGRADFDFNDNVLSLQGPNNIIGRAAVVHAGVDDLGRTNHPDSKTTGNAGGRLACGVIGVV